MATLHFTKLTALIALLSTALIALACSGGEDAASLGPGVTTSPGSTAPSGLSVTLYASPT